jgi:hypothetical protein
MGAPINPAYEIPHWQLSRMDSDTQRAARRLVWAARHLYPAVVEAERARIWDEQLAAQNARAEAERARLVALYPDPEAARAAWRETGNREGFRVWQDADCRPCDMLRVTGDRVVTARGAEVPLAEARAAWRFIVARIASGRIPWQPDGLAGARAGGFALSRIEADGTAVFGCHRFSLAEMRRAAAIVGEQ